MKAVLGTQVENLKEELEAKKGQITAMMEALKYQSDEKKKITDQIVLIKEE